MLPTKLNILLSDLLFPYFQIYLKFLNNEKKLRNKKNKSQLEKGILMLLSLMISEMSSPLPSTDTYMVSIPVV